jgi:hypothetical protein
MNPGYLSWLLMVISIILFASGWKDVLMSGMTSKVILLFFVSTLVCMQVNFTFPNGKFSLWVAVLLTGGLFTLWRLEGLINKLHAISVAILISSISLFMQETAYMFPSLVFGSMELTMALIIGILVAMTIKSPSVQVAVLSIGLVLSEVYYVYIHSKQTGIELGSLKLLDRWWLHIFIARGLSTLTKYIFLAGRQSLISIKNRIRLNLKKKLGSKE